MNIEPALKALAAALAGDGPAVQLSPGATPNDDPVITYIPREEWDTDGRLDGGLIDGGLDGALDDDSETHIAAVVATSGSTGTPKRTMLSVHSLAASSVGTAIALGGEGQWLLALPVHYVAGLQVLVRSLFAGTRPWVMDSSNGFTAEAFTEAAEELTDRIRYTSLVPTQLARLLEDPSERTLAALRRFNAILLGGAPASRALLDAARDAGVRVVTTYGMSETCGGCVYDGVPLDGVKVAIRDGRVWLGGDVVASGYLGDPAQTKASFSTEAGADSADSEDNEDGEDGPETWYQTGDLGAVDEDGRLQIHGRVDDVIITGGLKVSAGVVARALLDVDGVSDVFVGGVADTRWGQRVAAAVVGQCSEGELLHAAAAALEAHAVPKNVVFVSEFPRLSTGKPDRRALLALLDSAINDGA